MSSSRNATGEGRTRWFSCTANEMPSRRGVYEVRSVGFAKASNSSQNGFSFWSGETWGRQARTVEDAAIQSTKHPVAPVTHWRGLLRCVGLSTYHSPLHIVRLLAAYRFGGKVEASARLVLLCGVDHETKIVEGEWMGYTVNDGVRTPFVLEVTATAVLSLGAADMNTTLLGKNLRAGELFTIGDEHVYEIESCIVPRYQMVRLSATSVKPDEDDKLVVLCGVDEGNSIISNTVWPGYVVGEGERTPMLLDLTGPATLNYGENETDLTTLGTKPLVHGLEFSVFNLPAEEDAWEALLCVRTCEVYSLPTPKRD